MNEEDYNELKEEDRYESYGGKDSGYNFNGTKVMECSYSSLAPTSEEIIDNYNNGNLDTFREQLNDLTLEERDCFIIDWCCAGKAHHDVLCIILRYLN